MYTHAKSPGFKSTKVTIRVERLRCPLPDEGIRGGRLKSARYLSEIINNYRYY